MAGAVTTGACEPTSARDKRARRPKAAKLDDPRLCQVVTTWLDELWSPDEIARRLRQEFPNDPMM